MHGRDFTIFNHMKRWKGAVVYCWVLLTWLSSYSQATVTGIVIDAETMENLPGVNVTAGERGTTTDAEGQFTLTLVTGQPIAFSFVGYRSLDTLLYTTGDTHRIALSPSSTLLTQVVITSSRFAKPLGEVVESLDILSADLIAQQSNASLDDALERMSGVQIIDGQPNIRGGSGYSYGAGSRVLVLLDNMPILAGDAGFPNWSFLPIEHVEQVEISKGAASVLYGSAALNGVINLRTAYPTAQPQTKAALFSGLYAAPRDSVQRWFGNQSPSFAGIEFSHRQRLGPVDLIIGGYGYAEDSYLEDDYSRRGRLSFTTRHRLPGLKGLTAGLSGNLSQSRSTNFFLWLNEAEGAFRPLPNTMSLNEAFRFNLDPFIQYVTPKNIKHLLQARYYRSDNQTNANQNNAADLLYGEYQFNLPLPDLSLQVLGGIVGTYVHSVAQLYGDTTHSSNNAAAYLQVEKTIGGRLTVLGGARYERNQMNKEPFDARPVFRLGANYQAADYTYLRASFGQGYRFPTIAERFIRTDIGLISIFPNSDLQRESGYSAEVGIKQGISIGNWQGFVDAALFHTAYQNMMEFTFGGTDGSLFGFQSVNIGDTRINGGEITLTGQGAIGPVPFSLMAGYVYIDPVYQDFDSTTAQLSSAENNVLKYRFRHTANLVAQTDFNKWNIGLAARYYSRMEAIDFVFEQLIPGVKAYREQQTTGDWVWDVNVNWQLTKALQISGVVRNVFNRNYSLRPAIMEAPRHYLIRLSANVGG